MDKAELAKSSLNKNFHSSNSNEEINLQEIVSTIWQGKWILLLSVLSVLLLTSAYLMFKAPQYKTNTLLQVEDKQAGLGGNLTQDLSRFFSSNASVIDTTKTLIKSSFILGPVIRQLHLDIITKPQNEQFVVSEFRSESPHGLKSKWVKLIVEKPGEYKLYSKEGELLLAAGRVGQIEKTIPTAQIPQITIKVDKLVAAPGTEFFIGKKMLSLVEAKLLKNIQVEDLNGPNRPFGNASGLLKITVSSTNPQQAVDIANTITSIIVKGNIARKIDEIDKLSKFLQQQYEATKADLIDAEVKLEKFQTDNELKKDRNSTKLAVISLQRDVEIKTQLNRLVLTKLEELRFLKAGVVSDMRILTAAQLPDRAVPSKAEIILSAAFLLGLMIGLAIIFIYKIFKQHIDDPYWLEKHADISNLAIIPHSSAQTKNNRAFKKKVNSRLIILAESTPRDMAIESLRNLRTSMQFILPNTNNNIITIMGISPGIGKSFVSVNLAYLFADIKRILLVDGDIRKGHLHNYFGLKPTPGLSEVIIGKATLDDAIVKTQCANLDFLPSGAYPSNPAELLMTEQFKQLLKTASEKYDLVIIDTSPVLASTDNALIAKHAGTNLLVLGAAQHSKKSAEIALKQLYHNGVTLHGSIYNNSKLVQSHSYGSYYYYYSSDANRKLDTTNTP